MKRAGVVFPVPEATDRHISDMEVNVSTELIISILNKLKVSYIRLVEHGLKGPYFKSLLGCLQVVECAENRFDFGLTFYHENIALFAKKNELVQCRSYALLGHYGGGVTLSRKGHNFKAYSTICHHLKHCVRFSEPHTGITVNSARKSFANLSEFFQRLKEDPPKFGTRYEVSLFNIQPNDLVKCSQEQLMWMVDFTENHFDRIQVPMEKYFANIKNNLSYF